MCPPGFDMRRVCKIPRVRLPDGPGKMKVEKEYQSIFRKEFKCGDF
jgi:hypothetical protein